MGLFDAPLSLIESERGHVTYLAGLLSPVQAEMYFSAFHDGIDWHSQRRVMYEREVDVPRLTAHFRLDREAGHAVDGITEKAHEILRDVAGRVSEEVHAPFNSVGLNFYRNGNDSVAPHNDRLQELVAGEPIALLSLGATRRMLIRSKRVGEPAIPIDLAAGSLLVMSYASQHHFTHGIAKTRAPVGPRISVAFRVRPTE
ncbi:MAG TPA: alpha-ketoglutarate-dependent dioxygenase AlkB [Rhodanobacteraceae bacterium]|nr:alpha-ketoglutarate-dependent dioxygenase AlkB [Rhodanobacteraceae bacterium]